MNLNPILAAVALVVGLKNGAPIETATGFFFKAGDEPFFVTNKHVALGDPGNGSPPSLPDTLQLTLHTEETNITKSDVLKLPLYDKDKKRTWKEHSAPPVVDLAMISLRDVDLKRFVIHWIDDSYKLPPDHSVPPGEDVFIMGYPEAFFDAAHNLPIMRNAFIASTYGVPFRGWPIFLTDARLHPGTSGSPVFAKPKSTWVDRDGNTMLSSGTHYYLLGISSGTIKWPPTNPAPDPLGLGIAWYPSLLEEIAHQK